MLHGENKYREHQATDVRLLPVKKMMVVVVSMQQKAVVGKPPEWFLQGGEIFITEFAYAGSRFARLCGFFWRLAHFFLCKDRWGLQVLEPV